MRPEHRRRPNDHRLLHGIADQETARLRDGTRPWSWWLERAVLHGRRHTYTDILLISAQWRGATDVRSYAAWHSAGRQVRRGETGIRVLGRTGTPRAVFDVSQTDGLPLPANSAPPPPGAGLHLADLMADAPDRGVRRMEADSVAFLAAAWLGYDPPMPDFPSLAFWAGPGLGDRILQTARRLYARVSGTSHPGIMADAHHFFRAHLKAAWVPAYLSGRGFPPGVQHHWQIGYAPAEPHTLTTHLRTRGHDDEEIITTGLARPDHSGRLRDTFRDRAMFAIRTLDGAIAGFIGRRHNSAPGPKYLNSPETSLFHKGELLYGLHEARDRLAAGARPVLVEGPLDAIAVTMAGPTEYAAVATCGLTPTPAQLQALAQAADLETTGVLVALDADPAGRSGTVRTWERLAKINGPVETAALPPDQDPADLLHSKGRAAVLQALHSRTPLIDTVIDAAIERAGGNLTTPEEHLAAIRAASRIIATRPAESARQVIRVATRLDVPPALITEILIDTVSP
ncbi:MAG: toprim domain-containing protein [Spirillospora sp.]